MMQTLDEIRFLSSKIADKRSKSDGRKSDISNILQGLEGIASRLSLEIRNKDYDSYNSDRDKMNLLVL